MNPSKTIQAKKPSKKYPELMEYDSPKNKQSEPVTTKNQSFVPMSINEGERINFQSEDSEGSDISYESSIEEEQDFNIGQIQYFKQEMGRFFINYPELINNDIIEEVGDAKDYNDQSNELNKHWTLISDQILSEAKESSSFLQSLSRRIALYRSKIYQEDIIDILLKEQKNIMKEIDLQISLKKKQVKGTKNIMMEHIEGSENMYFSWRKKKEMQNKLTLQKQSIDRPASNETKNKKDNQNKRSLTPCKQNFRKYSEFQKETSQQQKLSKNCSQMSNPQGGFFLTTSNDFVNQEQKYQKNQTKQQNSSGFSKEKRRQHASSQKLKKSQSVSKIYRENNKQNSLGFSKGVSKQDDDKSNFYSNPNNSQCQQNYNIQNPASTSQQFWKHLVNFEPRTQAGRQLCQLIRKNNTPNDQLGIKKTILSYLARSKEMVQNEIILKSTISQKIQKLYNDDSKQLLMFYPTKMSAPPQNTYSNVQSKDNPGDQNRPSTLMANGLLGNYLSDQGNQTDFREQEPHFKNSNGQSIGNYQASSSNKDKENDLGNKLFEEGQNFMNLLQDVVDGPLMKYWMMMQQNKM